MRTIAKLFSASALTVAGLAFTPSLFAADVTGSTPAASGTNTETSTTMVQTNNNSGNNAAVAAPDADDIRKTVVKVTENALNKGNFDDVADYLVDADRDRVKQFKSPDNFAKLDGRIDQFLKDWKAKYNEDFSFGNRNEVLNDQFARIVQGEIGEARTAGNKEMPSAEPKNVTGGSAAELKKSGVATPDANSNKTGGGDTNRDPGRNIATLIIKPSASASAQIKPGQTPAVSGHMEANKELAVPLIHELPDTWKIDLPDNVDGQKLHDNLLKHITMVDEMHESWPTDKNEAYREVARHVLMALTESGT